MGIPRYPYKTFKQCSLINCANLSNWFLTPEVKLNLGVKKEFGLKIKGQVDKKNAISPHTYVRPIKVWDLKGPLKWVPTFPTSSTIRLFKNKPLNY